MELRDRLVLRYRLSSQIVDPAAVSNEMAGRLNTFGKFESHLRKLQQGALAKLKEVRARDPHAIARGEAKPLLDEVTAHDQMITLTRILTDRDFFLWFRDMWVLSLAVLQQFNLPTPLRRKIEQTAKYWASKQSPKTKKNKGVGIEDRYDFTISLYLDQLETVREQHAAILDALAKGKVMSEGNGKIQAGPFTLVNTGGFSDEIMNDVANTVQKAAALLTQHGLGKVCYGEILVSKKVGRANVLAFYLKDSDEMFVRAGLRINVDSIRTIIHELGHRLHRKFLAGKDREISSLYAKYNTRKTLRLDNPEPPPIGDSVPYKGKEIFVTRIDRLKGKVWLGEPGGNPDRYSIPLRDYALFKGSAPSAEPNPKGFVTPYAGKSPEENLAEMVSFYCMDKLSSEQVEDLEVILN